MLAQVDPRVAAKQRQHEADEADELLAGPAVLGIDESEDGEEGEERGGVAGREGVPAVQIDAFHNRLLPGVVKGRVLVHQTLEEDLGPGHAPARFDDMCDDGGESFGRAKDERPDGAPAE